MPVFQYIGREEKKARFIWRTFCKIHWIVPYTYSHIFRDIQTYMHITSSTQKQDHLTGNAQYIKYGTQKHLAISATCANNSPITLLWNDRDTHCWSRLHITFPCTNTIALHTRLHAHSAIFAQYTKHFWHAHTHICMYVECSSAVSLHKHMGQLTSGSFVIARHSS